MAQVDLLRGLLQKEWGAKVLHGEFLPRTCFSTDKFVHIHVRKKGQSHSREGYLCYYTTTLEILVIYYSPSSTK